MNSPTGYLVSYILPGGVVVRHPVIGYTDTALVFDDDGYVRTVEAYGNILGATSRNVHPIPDPKPLH